MPRQQKKGPPIRPLPHRRQLPLSPLCHHTKPSSRSAAAAAHGHIFRASTTCVPLPLRHHLLSSPCSGPPPRCERGQAGPHGHRLRDHPAPPPSPPLPGAAPEPPRCAGLFSPSTQRRQAAFRPLPSPRPALSHACRIPLGRTRAWEPPERIGKRGEKGVVTFPFLLKASKSRLASNRKTWTRFPELPASNMTAHLLASMGTHLLPAAAAD